MSSSSPLEKIENRSSLTAVKADDEPSLLSSLPEQIVLSCLARVPRSYDLNISSVSKTLRSLVRSPELNRLRSLLHKSSIYACCREDHGRTFDSTFHWFTLRSTEKTKTTTAIEYRLVPVPFPSHPFMSGSSVVAVGSKIYVVSSDLWIIDTRSGKFTQGPSTKVSTVARGKSEVATGVIDGKIYLIRDENFQVEVFDPKSEIWGFAGEEKFEWKPRFCASLEEKIYMVGNEKSFSVYDPREVSSNRIVHLVNVKTISSMCVVENVLYACFRWNGLMWFDTKLSVWKRLVGLKGKAVHTLHVDAMAEYDGKLAVFSLRGDSRTDDRKSVWCKLVALHRVGEMICGIVEWSGVVATIPHSYSFLHCLAVSD